MTAKELFEELGYEENYHIEYIMYYNKEEEKYIWFSRTDETIEARFDIDMPLLKAINKQIEELNWNE